jgi:hypothetical protein
VSSKTYDGNLGGHAGADAACQSLADAAGLAGTWMAWLSDGASSPGLRFSRATVPYRLLDGATIAADWATLVAGGTLASPIDRDETGASLAALDAESSKTWSATSNAGAPDTANCGAFASNAGTAKGEVGHCTDPTSGSWTSAYAMEPCSRPHHLYCFEQ